MAGTLMCRTVEEIKSAAPEIVVTTGVCGCSWTDHGECAILDDRGRVDGWLCLRGIERIGTQ